MAKSKDALIQTRIPLDLDRWVKTEAKRAGLTVAGWLRGTLIGLRGKREAKYGVRRVEQ